VQTVAPNASRVYQWYAGDVRTTGVRTSLNARTDQQPVASTPVEFGTVNLMPADIIKQGLKGMGGALVVEPQGATWTEDAAGRASATVSVGTTVRFREHVLNHQHGLSLRFASDGTAALNHIVGEAPQDTGLFGLNYRAEPMWYRFGMAPESPTLGLGSLAQVETAWQGFSNICCTASGPAPGSTVGGDPQTPVMTVTAGQPFRLRLAMPTGLQRGSVWAVHGHMWQQDPYLNGTVPSQTLGNNVLGMWRGAQDGIVPGSSYDLLVPKAGGDAAIPGDYLMRDYQPNATLGGLWGILRVQ